MSSAGIPARSLKHFATHMLNEYMQRGWCIFEAWLGYR